MSFARDGYAVLRGAISGGAIAALREFVRKTYAEFDAGCVPRITHEEGVLWHAFEEWDGLPLDVLKGAVPAIEIALPDVVRVVETNAPQDVNWYCQLRSSFFRRCRRTPSVVPWHCDAEAASTAKYGRCVTAWLPLDSVGDGVLPSLELVSGSHLFVRDYRGEPPVALHRPDEWVAGVPGERVVPRLEPRDVLLTDHHLLHRTEILPDYSSGRLSCELRFAP